MYSLILGFIITQFFGIRYNIKKSYKESHHMPLINRILYSDYNSEMGWFGRFLWYNLLGIILTVLILKIFTGEHKFEEHTKVQYIENLADNTQISGSFFLGSGQVGETWKYTYYIKKNGAYYIKNIDADGIPIIPITSGKPRIEWTITKDIGDYNWTIRFLPTSSKPRIYVPKGSIKQNYNLDASK